MCIFYSCGLPDIRLYYKNKKAVVNIKHYKVEIIIDNEKQEQRIEELARRFKKINGWNEQQVIQFMLSGFPKIYDTLLSLMEIKADEWD